MVCCVGLLTRLPGYDTVAMLQDKVHAIHFARGGVYSATVVVVFLKNDYGFSTAALVSVQGLLLVFLQKTFPPKAVNHTTMHTVVHAQTSCMCTS